MSTAIVRTYTPEGFVIAADGRVRNEDGNVVRDQAQKIFPIGGNNIRYLAYSISGTAGIPSRDATEVAFDFGLSAGIRENIQISALRRNS